MKPRISVLTLAVDDLERAVSFYRDGLGLQTNGIIGTEFKGHETHPSGAAVMFELHSFSCVRWCTMHNISTGNKL